MKSRKQPGRLVVGGVTVALLLGGVSAAAQVSSSDRQASAHAPGDPVQVLAQQVRELTVMILELRSEIAQSREETREARRELQWVLTRLPAAGEVLQRADVDLTATANPQIEFQQTAVSATDVEPAERLLRLEENQQLLTDRISEHYQTKVESASRYRSKLSGIVMLNVFRNRGHVDSPEVPNTALPKGLVDTGSTFGLTALQSELGFETYGPTLAGGRASAALRFDFFGVNSQGEYNTSWGGVRLRTATMRLDWNRSSLVVGQDVPFLSPSSPTSVASLGYPAFSSAGNLWAWVPQIRIEHRYRVSESGSFSLQGGIIDPVPRGSGQPAYGTRLAWSHGDPENALTLGMGSYYSRQNYGASRTVDGWAGMADWSIPFGSRFTLSGELYRGRALGGLGGAQGRNVLYGGIPSDPASGVQGLNTSGGWAQMKFKISEAIDIHAAHGQDDPHNNDLRRYYFVYGDTLVSRNTSQMINVIYRPRTDLIFTMEYRRLRSWKLNSEDNAGHVNLGVGVLF